MGNVINPQPDRYHCDSCQIYSNAMSGFSTLETRLFPQPPSPSPSPSRKDTTMSSRTEPQSSRSESESHASTTTTSTNVSTFRSLSNAGDVVIEAFAGVVSGTAGVLATQPFDTIKVKMQCFPERYKGVVDCFSQTVARGGARELYAGTLPSLVTEVAENAMVFPLYCMSHTMLRWSMISGATRNKSNQNGNEDSSKLHTFFDSLISGAFAGGALAFLLAPAELVKCKLQSYQEAAAVNAGGRQPGNLWNVNLAVPLDTKPSTLQLQPRMTPYSTIRSVLALQGVPGLFRGLSSTCLRELSGYSVFFASYELGTQMWYGAAAHDDLHLVGATVFGAISGGLGWSVCLPFDVVKSRIQAGIAPPKFLDAFRHIVRREGVRALFLGYTPALLRVMPQNGIIMLVYETIRMYGREWFVDHNKQPHIETKDR